MRTPQPGTFALGTASPADLEFDAPGADAAGRDALTRYTTALTGAYYFVPSEQVLLRFAPADDEEED